MSVLLPKFAMSLSFMQPLPEIRFPCFNPMKITKQHSCFLHIRLMKNSTHSIPSSLQRNTLRVEFEVHITKPKTFLPYCSLPTIQKTDQWNGLVIMPSKPSSIKAHSRLKPMPLPCLSLHISSHSHSSRPL